MNPEPASPYDLRADVRRMLHAIPPSCAVAKIYPAGPNFCECYLLAEAVKVNFAPNQEFKVTSNRESRTVTAMHIDVNFLYDLTVNREGAGAELRGPADSAYFSLQRDDVIAVLAGSRELVGRAIPYPDDIWTAYFEQIMRANEPKAFKLVLDEYCAWLQHRAE